MNEEQVREIAQKACATSNRGIRRLYEVAREAGALD